MDNVTTNNYNAPLRTKVAVVAGTAVATTACIANMMRKRNIKHVRNLEMGIKEGVDLCIASTVGGFTAGMVVDDKKHRKAKVKDAVNQLIGNTFIPFGSLAIANKLTKPLPMLARTLIAIGTLIGTTFLGHNVANKVNEKVFKEDSGYKTSLKDFIFDADDIGFAASTVLKSKWLYNLTATVVPVTYMMHGYLAGTRQENNTKTLDKYV